MQTKKTLEQQAILSHLRTLLLTGNVGTQEEIRQALNAEGLNITQSKISRLLRKVGAVKSKNEQGEIVYRLPKEPAPPTKKSPLDELVLEIVSNGQLIIVRTSPGAASLVGRLLDYQQESCGILGSVAGDDALLVVPMDVSKITDTEQKIKQLLMD